MVFFYKNMSKNTKTFGGLKFSVYLCRREAALGNLKASFHCAHLHYLCTDKNN